MNSVTRALGMMSDKPGIHGVCVKLGDLRALSARVEELEAALDSEHASVGSNIWRFWRDQALDIARSKDDAEKAARLQGLNEAKATVRKIARECRAYSNHPPSNPGAAEWKAQRMREAYQLSRAENAIEALKGETTND